MRNLALADLKPADVEAMLKENETLFVEHKSGLAFATAKAICSFANTLGGWVLIGVDDTTKTITDGQPDAWEVCAAAELTDKVRECLQKAGVDPIPAFTATVPDFLEPGKRVGVVRVYESDDAPHVMGDGNVYVRGVAQDRKVGKKDAYHAKGVDTQVALFQLVERGRRGTESARSRLATEGEFVRARLGLKRVGTTHLMVPEGTVVLRAAPVTRARMTDWAVSAEARAAIRAAVTELIGDPSYIEDFLHVSGLGATGGGERPVLPDIQERRFIHACAATDSVGILGTSLGFGHQQPARDGYRLTIEGFAKLAIVPVLRATCGILRAGELYGRSHLHLLVGDLVQTVQLDYDGQLKKIPHNLPLGGEISLPLADDEAELHALARRWADDIARRCRVRALPLAGAGLSTRPGGLDAHTAAPRTQHRRCNPSAAPCLAVRVQEPAVPVSSPVPANPPCGRRARWDRSRLDRQPVARGTSGGYCTSEEPRA